MSITSSYQSPNPLAALAQARSQTDSLFALVSPEKFYDRPIAERHRMIFYLGHLEAFDWNLVCRRALDVPSFHQEFDKLFAFGIDPPVGQLPQDQPSDWPSIEEVTSYNHRVRETLDRLMDNAPRQLIQCAIEHRLMHADTFAYILHNENHARPLTPLPPSSPPPLEMISIPAGTATLGLSGDAFGWDNEFPETSIPVPAFAISRYKVTNGDYLSFVNSGAAPPHYWTRRDGAWFYRGVFAEYPLPLDWPVYVTRTEAAAYAKSLGMSLPTEAQFHRAAYGTPTGKERDLPWGSEPPTTQRGNFDFARWDPLPVTANPEGDSAFGVSQLAGNGWEWTSTPFSPFPGFERFPFYPGYSAPFFDGDHFVVKGAAPRTAACFLRRSFRNWYRQGYPYVHAAFRCVDVR
ncbi:MAG: Hercynine oxygenase [Bryobacteraceae bacterium]|nr:Hercynine oxygenase [Bryobacteraceae bacterium]